MTKPIAVLICDDHPRIRESLEALIDAHPDMALAGIAEDGAQAINLSRAHQPTVALVDCRMPGGDKHAVVGIREQSPHTRIIVFSGLADTATRDAMKQAGADQYLPKGTPVKEIVAAIRALAASER